MRAKKKRRVAPLQYHCDRCGTALKGWGRHHRAGALSRTPRDEWLCGDCMRVARREDRRDNFLLFLGAVGLILLFTAIELYFTRPG